MKLLSRLLNQHRTDRLQVKYFHNISIQINNQEFELHNISSGGIGLIVPSDIQKFTKGENYPAQAKIHQNICQLEIQAVHQTGDVAGFKVISSEASYQKYLNNYFQSELAGIKLQKISSTSLRPDIHGEPHWYYGDVNHELYYTVRDGKVTTFHLNYQGHMIILSSDGKVTIGQVLEEDRPGEHKTANLVSTESELPEDIQSYMVRFIDSIKDLHSDHRKQITQKFPF